MIKLIFRFIFLIICIIFIYIIAPLFIIIINIIGVIWEGEIYISYKDYKDMRWNEEYKTIFDWYLKKKIDE